MPSIGKIVNCVWSPVAMNAKQRADLPEALTHPAARVATAMFWVTLSLAACAPAPKPDDAARPIHTPPQAQGLEASGDVADGEPDPNRTETTPEPAPEPTPEPVAVQALGVVTHVLDRPVASLALGRPGAAALVVDETALTPWWTDAAGVWREMPLPPALAWAPESSTSARIHYGRNNKPRILGTRVVEGAPAPLYLRYRGSAWVADREEVAELFKGPTSGLYGVLGWDDPEVVCKVGATCLIKRLSGWQRMDAVAEPSRVDVGIADAWAIWPDSVSVLDGLAWRTVSSGAELEQARGYWGDGRELWISDAAGAGLLWHRSESQWRTTPSPVGSPEQLWGRGPNDVWLAGQEGLAHYDGTSWVRVAGVEGPLSDVLGRPGEVWAGGASGVWRVSWAGVAIQQTEDRPTTDTPAFQGRMALLWEAIVRDDPEHAMPAFFPLEAYQQVKAIADPTSDWNQRLVAAFKRSVHTSHARLGANPELAELVGVEVKDDKARWMVPGSEGNALGYFRVTRSRLQYRPTPEATPVDLDISSMISWRGEWFVVHLDGMK